MLLERGEAVLIDSHHHLWNYSDSDYPWMRDEPGESLKTRLRRDYGPAELAGVVGRLGVSGTVAVQARQTEQETEWLLTLANTDNLIKGVVGWAPLASPNVGDVLDRWADEERLVGIRHVVQDEPDGFLDAQEFNDGVASLNSRGLVYDILVFPRQLAEAIRFVDRHPNQSLVLDHAAKPRIGATFDSEWAKDVRDLARRENVTCKLSGLATEVQLPQWDADLLRPYIDVLLEAFTPERLMWGSDWPVALIATGYERWLLACQSITAGLSKPERDALFSQTASRVYGLA